MGKINFKFFIPLFFSLLCSINGVKYSCQNYAGESVDWFTIFMYPRSSSVKDTINFGYLDNLSTSIKYIEYKKGNFPPIEMSRAIYPKTEDKVNFFFWNDEVGDYKNSEKAHSKGSLVYDKNGGYFISHSLPKFPEFDGEKISNDFPDNAGIYAQSWLCISITKSEAINVAKQLNIINPDIFIKVDKDQVDSPADPTITKLIKNRGDPKLPSTDHTKIVSKGNVTFDVFSKSKEYNDLQWDLSIPNEFKDDFYSETWTRPSRLPSVCSSKYKVLNVLALKFGDFEFEDNNEHSKWGVAMTKNIICIGDLNRTESQKSRGGLVSCFTSQLVAKTIRGVITDYELCKKPELNFLSEDEQR